MPDQVAVFLKQPLLCNTNLGIPRNCSFTEPPNPTYDAQSETCNDVTLEVRRNVQDSSLVTFVGAP